MLWISKIYDSSAPYPWNLCWKWLIVCRIIHRAKSETSKFLCPIWNW